MSVFSQPPPKPTALQGPGFFGTIMDGLNGRREIRRGAPVVNPDTGEVRVPLYDSHENFIDWGHYNDRDRERWGSGPLDRGESIKQGRAESKLWGVIRENRQLDADIREADRNERAEERRQQQGQFEASLNERIQATRDQTSLLEKRIAQEGVRDGNQFQVALRQIQDGRDARREDNRLLREQLSLNHQMRGRELDQARDIERFRAENGRTLGLIDLAMNMMRA